jgi:hypothetical protein
MYAPVVAVTRVTSPKEVILRRAAPKGSLSTQGFSCRGAKAILSALCASG